MRCVRSRQATESSAYQTCVDIVVAYPSDKSKPPVQYICYCTFSSYNVVAVPLIYCLGMQQLLHITPLYGIYNSPEMFNLKLYRTISSNTYLHWYNHKYLVHKHSYILILHKTDT